MESPDIRDLLESAPPEIQCDITGRIPFSYPDFLAMKRSNNYYTPCIVILAEKKRGMEEVRIPWREVKDSNIRYIEEPYILAIDHYDTLIEIARKRRLLSTNLDILRFAQELNLSNSVDDSLLRGKYLTDEEIRLYQVGRSRFKREILHRGRLIAAFINARLDLNQEENYSFFFNDSLTFTPTSIDSSLSGDTLEMVLSRIQGRKRGFLVSYTGAFTPSIMYLLVTYPNLRNVHFLENAFQMDNVSILPLLEEGVERITFDIDEDSLSYAPQTMTDTTFSQIRAGNLTFPHVKEIQLPIRTEEQLRSLEEFFPQATESIFFYDYQGKIPSYIYRKYRYVMEY